MHIDSHEALGVLNTLFEILAPSSLRPVDMLLRSMFVTPDTMVSACLPAPRVRPVAGLRFHTVPCGRDAASEPEVQGRVGGMAEAGAFHPSDGPSEQRGSLSFPVTRVSPLLRGR